MAGKEIVQTELEMREYEVLRRVVEKRGLMIKQGLREAIQQWIAKQIPLKEDPLFKVKPVKTGVETESSNLDKALYTGSSTRLIDTSEMRASNPSFNHPI